MQNVSLDELKQRVKKLLAEKILLASFENKISKEDARSIALQLVNKINASKTKEEILKAVEEVNIRWPFFEEVYKILKSEVEEEKKEKIIKKLQAYIQQ